MKHTMHLLFQCSVVLFSLVCQIVSLGINENYMLLENDAMIVSSASTYDTTTRTQLKCAFKCLQNINCSAASYQDTKCRLETSKNFSATQLAGATIMIREQGSVIQYRQEETMALNESFSYTTANSENQTETVTNTTTADGNTATQSYTTEQSGTTTNERASHTANTHMAIQTTAQSVRGFSLQTTEQTTQSDTNIDVQTTTHTAQLSSDMALQTSSHTTPSDVDTTVQTNLHTATSGGDTTVQSTHTAQSGGYTTVQTTSHTAQSGGDTTVHMTSLTTQSDHNMALQTISRTTQPDDTTVQATSHTAEGSTTKYSFITTRDGFTSTGGHSYTTKDDHSISADFKFSTEEFLTTKEHKLTTRNEETTTNVLEQTSFEVLSTTHSICFGFPEYIYHNTKMSLPDAQAVCSGEGGKVVEIETAEEEICLNYLFNFYYENWYWIGAYNYNADSTYEYWSDPTSPLSFTKWENGQPTRTSSQLCIYASWSSQYKWKSGDCSLNNAFICEINQ